MVEEISTPREHIPAVEFNEDLNKLMQSLGETLETGGRCKLELNDEQVEPLVQQVINSVRGRVGGRRVSNLKIKIKEEKCHTNLSIGATGGDINIKIILENSEISGKIKTTELVANPQRRMLWNIQAEAEKQLGGDVVDTELRRFFVKEIGDVGITLGGLGLRITPDDRLRIDFKKKDYKPQVVKPSEKRDMEGTQPAKESEPPPEAMFADPLERGVINTKVNKLSKKEVLTRVEELAKLRLEGELDSISEQELNRKLKDLLPTEETLNIFELMLGRANFFIEGDISRFKQIPDNLNERLIEYRMESDLREITFAERGVSGKRRSLSEVAYYLRKKQDVLNELIKLKGEQVETEGVQAGVPVEPKVEDSPPGEGEEVEVKELKPSDFRPKARYIEAILVKTRDGAEKIVVYWWDGERQVKEVWSADWDRRLYVGWKYVKDEKRAKKRKIGSVSYYKKSENTSAVIKNYSFEAIPPWMEPAEELAAELLRDVQKKDYPGFRQEEKAELAISNYLERLSHGRENFEEAKYEYKKASERVEEQKPRRKTVFGPSLEVKQENYERLFDIALYEYEKDLKNISHYMEGRLIEEKIDDDDPDYEQFKKLGIDAMRLYSERIKKEDFRELTPEEAMARMENYAKLVNGRVNVFKKIQGLEDKELADKPVVEKPQDVEKEIIKLAEPRENARRYRAIKVSYSESEEPKRVLFFETNDKKTFAELVDERGEKLKGSRMFEGPVRRGKYGDITDFDEIVDWVSRRIRAAENAVLEEVEIVIEKKGEEKMKLKHVVGTEGIPEVTLPLSEEGNEEERFIDFLENPPDVSELNSEERRENWNLVGETFGWLRQRRSELVGSGVDFGEDLGEIEKQLEEEFKERNSLGFVLSYLLTYYRILQREESEMREKGKASEEIKEE